MPTTGQLVLLILAIALFTAGGVCSLLRLWADSRKMRVVSRVFLGMGITASVGVLIWHSAQRPQWVPLGDNFDTLIWLATLLAMFVLYLQRHRHLGALDWFVMPLVVLMLVIAAVIGKTEYHDYVGGTWDWIHRVTSYVGAVAFAVAAGTGAMYIVASRRLRTHRAVGSQFGSLERLEHLTMTSVTLGFALLTIGMITGGIKMLGEGKHTPTSKIVLALIVWLVYAVVLHAPINPSFRGRKVAVLSVVGFVLMLGTIVTVLLMPQST